MNKEKYKSTLFALLFLSFSVDFFLVGIKMVNLSFGGLHSKEKKMAPFGFLLSFKSLTKTPTFCY